MSKKDLVFESQDNMVRRLRCPHCNELLTPADLETYCLCPYCNDKIENGGDLEDFVIDPLVKQWVERNKN